MSFINTKAVEMAGPHLVEKNNFVNSAPMTAFGKYYGIESLEPQYQYGIKFYFK